MDHVGRVVVDLPARVDLVYDASRAISPAAALVRPIRWKLFPKTAPDNFFRGNSKTHLNTFDIWIQALTFNIQLAQIKSSWTICPKYGER